jgi:Fe-S-cluster containining protein
MGIDNPCIQCGACCAFFRVSFPWEETSESDSNGVPFDLTEPVNEFLQCMKGTNQPHPRCLMLQGKIGTRVGCAIYNKRATTCRDFGLHCKNGHLQVDGENLERCNEARKAWNLPPLTRAQLRSFDHYLEVRNAPSVKHQNHNKSGLNR